MYMTIFCVHASFMNFDPGKPLKQQVHMPKMIGCNRAELIGYQVTFKKEVDLTVPDHIIVHFKPDWLHCHVASPGSAIGGNFPITYGLPLAIDGANTVKFGLKGLHFDTKAIIPRTFDIEIKHYDDRLLPPAGQGTDSIIPMERPTKRNGSNTYLNHIMLYFSIE